MQPWTYPARIERHPADGDAATWIVTFEDVPEAITEGFSFEDAAYQAGDALATAMAFHLKQGNPIPAPREAETGEVPITLEASIAARAALARIMADQGVTKVALAAKMGKDEKAVRRMLEPKGASLDMVFKALRAMGAQPMLSVDIR